MGLRDDHRVIVVGRGHDHVLRPGILLNSGAVGELNRDRLLVAVATDDEGDGASGGGSRSMRRSCSWPATGWPFI